MSPGRSENGGERDRDGVDNGVDDLIDRLDPGRLFIEIGRSHDEARRFYRAPGITADEQAGFVEAVSEYVCHHLSVTEDRQLSREAAFGIAVGILREDTPSSTLQDGYAESLLAGLGRGRGLLPNVLNLLARGIKARAIRAYVDALFYEKVDPLSSDQKRLFVQAFAARYGKALDRVAPGWEEALHSASTDSLVCLAHRTIEKLVVERNRFGNG